MNALIPVSHDVLVAEWCPEDYELIWGEGECAIMCSTTRVLSQRGVFRFGGAAGYSVEGLQCALESIGKSSLIQLGFTCADGVRHMVQYPLDKLTEFSELNEDLKPLADEIQEAIRQRGLPHFCKECRGVKSKNIELVNGLRCEANPVVICPGCEKVVRWTSQCSTLTCERDGVFAHGCFSGTKFCVYCVDGHTEEGISHHLFTCTEKTQELARSGAAFPKIKECKCS